MLDYDLARLYETETKRINESVSRNKNKFPERFCFKITEKEFNALKSQIATSKGGFRKGHTAFTEQGVAMLSTILKTKIAVEVSIAIMDAFVAMRHYIGNNEYRLSNVETKVIFNNTFHDRYFILDNSIVYHCGSSINRIGYKTFSITLISDKDVCDSLINKIYTLI